MKFRKFLRLASNSGLPFKAGLGPVVIKVLSPASLDPRSSVKKSIVPKRPSVILTPCEVTHSQKVVWHWV